MHCFWVVSYSWRPNINYDVGWSMHTENHVSKKHDRTEWHQTIFISGYINNVNNWWETKICAFNTSIISIFVVLAFLGGRPRALGLPAVGCFRLASSGFLVLGERSWPRLIPVDDATGDLGGGGYIHVPSLGRAPAPTRWRERGVGAEVVVLGKK